MSDVMAPKVAKWPFVLGDVLLLAAAYFICTQVAPPLSSAALALAVLCVMAGAFLSVLPFILEYRALAKMAEAASLTTVVSQVNQMEAVASQISHATGCWQNAQDAADKTAAAAKDIAERMGAEVKAFAESMQRMNDTEKATLRLEVEKLRRAEGDWVQVLTRVLDHVYALHTGAVKTGQPQLIEQLTQFQNGCRDAARRVGMVPFVPRAGDPFDPKRQVLEGNAAPPETATVASTVATGYTFQGRLVRPALVRLANEAITPAEPAQAAGGQPPARDAQATLL
jgi:molecular chaperone GrpE (heat shock protein)